MKKKYIEPSVMMMDIKLTAMICGSKDVQSDKGIDYGGVDEGGTIDPSSRRYNDAWGDEEEEY